MAKNVLQSTILSGAGAVAIAPGAQIEVRSPSGLLVPLWLDRDGTQPTTNPTTADSDGFFRVYLNSGRYHITARSGGESREWRDVLLGSAAGYDVDDMLAALAAGIYTSVAEGLAETAEGDFFWVAHETGEDVLTLYRVVESEAELWASLPRGYVVRELTDRAEAAAGSAEEDAQAAQDALNAILALGDLPSAVAAAEQAAQSASDSATAAATSESTASAAATAAEQAAQRAEDAAADTGLPSPIVPLSFLQAKADGSGYDGKTPAQVAETLGVTALSEELATLEQQLADLDSQLDCAIVYPNGGTADAPGTITVASRYVTPNPFPGHTVFCVLEVLYGGEWVRLRARSSNANYHGAWADQHDDGDIVTVTAAASILAGGSGSQNFAQSTAATAPTTNQTTLPARVKVWKLKGAI